MDILQARWHEACADHGATHAGSAQLDRVRRRAPSKALRPTSTAIAPASSIRINFGLKPSSSDTAQAAKASPASANAELYIRPMGRRMASVAACSSIRNDGLVPLHLKRRSRTCRQRDRCRRSEDRPRCWSMPGRLSLPELLACDEAARAASRIPDAGYAWKCAGIRNANMFMAKMVRLRRRERHLLNSIPAAVIDSCAARALPW